MVFCSNTFSDAAFVTQPSVSLLAPECDCSIGQRCPVLAVSLSIPVIKSERSRQCTNKQVKTGKQQSEFLLFPISASHPRLLSLPQTFRLHSACERRGQEREWRKRRDSSPTRFPGPCSPLIGSRGCGTHSSSVSGLISGFYQHLDKQLLHRQSQITGQQRDVV